MLATIEFSVSVDSNSRDFHALGFIRETADKLDMAARHSPSIGTEVLRDEDVTHLRTKRIHEPLPLENVRNALIVGVMSSHEPLSIDTNLFALRGRLEICRAFFDTGFDVIVKCTVLPILEHRRHTGGSLSQIETAGEHHHPGPV